MHKDFHLYGTYLAARLAGFAKEGARDIACAAQAVDDFTYGEYGSCAGNTDMAFTVRKEAKDILQTLWTTFHFLPVLDHVPEGLDKEETEKKFRTGPRGDFFGRLSTDLRKAFEKSELSGFQWAKAGVTMHVLADTFAHEGFSGLMSNTNTVAKVLANMDGAKDLDLGVLIGAFHLPTWAGKVMDTAKLGHGTAGHFPDISWLEYALTQDGGQRYRSNPKVFACAFGKMIEVLGIAHNGAARTDIGELIKGTLLRIEEERGVKIQQYGAMWFWTSRIASEERDTVFKHFMELDYFDLRDGYTPGNLDDDYKAYLDDVGIAGKELKDNPASDIINRHYFLNATVWHRENVMTEIWKKFPDFPSSLKMNPA